MTLSPSDSPDWTGIPGSMRYLGAVSVTGTGIVANSLAFTPASYDGAIYIVQDYNLTGSLYPKLVGVSEVSTGVQTLNAARPVAGDPPLVAFVSRVLGASWVVSVQADFTGTVPPVTATWYVFAVPTYPLVELAQPVNPLYVDVKAQSAAALTIVQDASAAFAGATAQLAIPAAGVKATTTFAAVSGFVWVVDSFSIRLLGRGTAEVLTVFIQSATAGFIWENRLSVGAVAGDHDEWTMGPGLGLTANIPTDALTVAFALAPAAANFQTVNVNAYLRSS